VRQTDQLPAAVLRCASGANCVSYPTLGEPSKLSRANPGPRCFACEKQRADLEVEGVAAELKAEQLKAEELKAAKHRQKQKPSRSESYEPEVSRAWAILLERRRASVGTCERGLQSAIASDDVRLTRRWSRSLREAQARLVWAEADLGASKKRAQSEQRR
jgi:hypothetical protein